MNRCYRHIFAALAVFVLCSCATEEGAMSPPTSASVSDIRKAVTAVTGEPRMISENGRELYSQYADKLGLKIDNSTKVKDRWYSKVTILGDRRPYDISVRVIQETKNEDGKFELAADDDEKAQALLKKIQDALHKGLERRNIIDDFRAF